MGTERDDRAMMISGRRARFAVLGITLAVFLNKQLALLGDVTDAHVWMERTLTDTTQLEFNNTGNTAGDDDDDDNDDNTAEYDYNNAEVFRNTLMIYGSIFVVVIFVFSLVRQKFSAYSTRSWVEGMQTHLAQNKHGLISWAWKVFDVSEENILNECGMDALCFLRIIRMGYKLSVVAMFNSIFLIPTYYKAPASSDTETVADWLARISIANVPAQSTFLLATVVASYIFFLYTIYLILQEFKWYIEMRHKFLKKPLPRHYTVFVRNIPIDSAIQSNQSLKRFFQKCFSQDAVLETHIPVHTPNLDKALSQRRKTLTQLEHSYAMLSRNGTRPMHRITVTGEPVDSIDCYKGLLEEQNARVAELMTIVQSTINETEGVADTQLNSSLSMQAPLLNDIVDPSTDALSVSNSQQNEASNNGERSVDIITQTFNTATNAAKTVVNTTAGVVTTVATTAATTATTLVVGREDGHIYSSGFIVFTKLSTANAALQMVHHSTPFAMRILEAPDPSDVRWENIGRTHSDLQSGKLTSFALTAVLCLVWTVPTSFLASLANAETVREEFKFLQDFFEKYPNAVFLFQILSPLLLVLLNSLLPIIFESITYFEGHIGSGLVQSSKFIKLGFFMIVQTFFVSAISGTIVQALESILNDPSSIVEFLATSLPSQSTYFMDIIIVYTVRNATFELLRINPLIFAAIRKFVGPRLTETERQQPFLGLRPISNPFYFAQAFYESHIVLFYMILFVYAVIQPMAPLVTAICFMILEGVFRHNFIYVYPSGRDSGGNMWAVFLQFTLAAIFIAELTIIGLLSLNRSALAVSLMIPLIIITLLFILYIQQTHFQVAAHLPSHECVAEDDLRGDDMDFSFVRGAYIQPSLAAEMNVAPDPSLVVGEPPRVTDEIDLVINA